MLKRKISDVKIRSSKIKSRSQIEKIENIAEKRNKILQKFRKMDGLLEDCEPGRYVRLRNKPIASTSDKKKLKKLSKGVLLKNKPKKVTLQRINNNDVKDVEAKKLPKIKLENDEECNRILKELNFDKPSVLSGINALFKVLEQKKENANQLFDLDTPIFLQLTSMKIPICPSRTLRLPLKHSLHSSDCTVCFIVGDVKGIFVKEHERVVERYEKLFSDNGVETKIHKILPMHELRTEYGEFEMKRKLLCTYDVFFVDGKISKYVSRHLGKIFRTKRRLPIPIRLERGMAVQMKHAMLRTSMNLHGQGNNYTVQIGHCNMTVRQIYENILSVCSKLIHEYPGGWPNVKSVNLKTDLSMAIPLYLSLKNPTEVKVPRLRGRRSKSFRPYTDELSTRVDSKVTVYPTGNVVIQKIVSSRKRKLETNDQ